MVTVTVPTLVGVNVKVTGMPPLVLNASGAEASELSAFLKTTEKSQFAFPFPTIVKTPDCTLTKPPVGPENSNSAAWLAVGAKTPKPRTEIAIESRIATFFCFFNNPEYMHAPTHLMN